ncbi:hypothetical protein [Scytonema sp. NUACC26]|uniref:hypothetical protein n=1 Tax=Scytonema sp. NUACC26 TaxID=3140176 RepID=UPI0038B295F4
MTSDRKLLPLGFKITELCSGAMPYNGEWWALALPTLSTRTNELFQGTLKHASRLDRKMRSFGYRCSFMGKYIKNDRYIGR